MRVLIQFQVVDLRGNAVSCDGSFLSMACRYTVLTDSCDGELLTV